MGCGSPAPSSAGMRRQKGEKILMNDGEKDSRTNEGRQVQQELEDQLRAFGDTMSDAFAHGFEGKGMDIGDRAYGVGRAAVRAANYGIDEAVRALRGAGRSGGAKQDPGEGDAAGLPGWFRQIFAKPQPTPVENIRISGKKRHDQGCALLAVGIVGVVTFGIAGISCLGAAAAAVPVWAEGVLTYTLAGALLTGGEMMALKICGSVFALITGGFGWMTAAGTVRLSAARMLQQLAEGMEGLDCQKGLPVETLAQFTGLKKAKLLKKLRRYIRKGWLAVWLDEKTETLYLTAEDYRTAQQKLRQQPVQQPEPEAEDSTHLNLETARRFAGVLEQEQQLMQDEQAREELEHMHRTTTAICDWLETHPESLPKTRRFAEYYIPTTLKLLHTYNDVQGQQGENADTIRRDIAGILHTLNQAFDNLYDNLLSDVALDVSSEIAALQGMLASDGLTGGDFR